MTATNAMITKVAEKFGASSSEAMLMRFTVRAYIVYRSKKYEDCEKVFKALMRKEVEK